MPRRAAATAIVVAALGAAGCGGDADGEIPRGEAEALLATLGEIEAKVESGDCTSAETDAAQFVAQVNALPKQAGTETKRILREMGQNLEQLTQQECDTPDIPDTGATGLSGEVGG